LPLPHRKVKSPGVAKPIRQLARSTNATYRGRHRYEHWLVDNQVYFITARCRDRFPAFATEAAKSVFWNRFDHYANEYGFVPWITSLLDNHYHTLGYLKRGECLPRFIQRFHGSIAKLANDLLSTRLTPFWRNAKGKEYFDGCIRDERQARLAYRYTLRQSMRHGIAQDWRQYPHTRVNIEVEAAIQRALELNAFLEGIPYKRYLNRQSPAR
jgi:REP element-mobilizing transposase RayT